VTEHADYPGGVSISWARELGRRRRRANAATRTTGTSASSQGAYAATLDEPEPPEPPAAPASVWDTGGGSGGVNDCVRDACDLWVGARATAVAFAYVFA
jgi:hypothetical protein